MSAAIASVHTVLVDEGYALPLHLHNQDREGIVTLIEVASQDPQIQVSADGHTFHPGKLPAPMELAVLPPGQSVEARVWLRSAQPLPDHPVLITLSTVGESVYAAQRGSTVFNRFEVPVTLSFVPAFEVHVDPILRPPGSASPCPAGLVALPDGAEELVRLEPLVLHTTLHNVAQAGLVITHLAWVPGSPSVRFPGPPVLVQRPEHDGAGGLSTGTPGYLLLEAGQRYHVYHDMQVRTPLLLLPGTSVEHRATLHVTWRRWVSASAGQRACRCSIFWTELILPACLPFPCAPRSYRCAGECEVTSTFPLGRVPLDESDVAVTLGRGDWMCPGCSGACP
jgi:hypothetical protein